MGRIIGKNPGSAVPEILTRGLQPIKLQGDHFLPSVLSIVRKAYDLRHFDYPEHAYIQVLNLFYLCNRDLREAKASLGVASTTSICASEKRSSPWSWYAWGGPDKQLDPLKARFLRKRPPNSFFYDRDAFSIVERKPRIDELAKHTQGMPHEAVVAHIASLLS